MGTRQLKKTELWAEDQEQAQLLWDTGFRPKYAMEISVGQSVALWQTDVFRLQGEGKFFIVKVTSIDVDEFGTREITTNDGSVTDADEYTEVWAK